ncbi:MAG: sigma-54-dependent transcriptional regulator [Candidatus Rifleibacteriota bacterium]
METTNQQNKILIVEDDRALGKMLAQELIENDIEAKWVNNGEKALATIAVLKPDLVVSDLRLPGINGLELLKKSSDAFAEEKPDFLIITAFGTISRAVEALKAGAEDFLTKPLDLEHFTLSVKRILRNRGLRNEIDNIKKFLSEDNFHGIIGQSRPMRLLYDKMIRVASAKGPVLILGESGTGKELVARAIHQLNKSAKGEFLAVNCAGIPEHLLESEFFGHKAGSFTGAGKDRSGIFAQARDGTLLLDEISEMPLFLQAKLLRMLQDGKIRPVGSDKEKQVKVRIIAATHQNIEDKIIKGDFRQDLFFRLETFTLKLPPLREREDDIELLANWFLQRHCIQMGKKIQGFENNVLNILNNYKFPGNVRELKNAIERAVTFCDDNKIKAEHLPRRIVESANVSSDDSAKRFITRHLATEELPSLSEIELQYINYVIDKFNGNKQKAASILGIGRRTLYRKLGQL